MYTHICMYVYTIYDIIFLYNSELEYGMFDTTQ